MKVLPAKSHQPLRRLFLWGVHVYIVFHMLAWYVFDWEIWGKTAMVGVLSLAMGHINSAAIMVVLILLSIILYGRFFCGWFCHLRGAIELADWVMRKMRLQKYKRIRDKNLLLNTRFSWSLRYITLFVLLIPVVSLYFRGKFHFNLNPEPLRPMTDLPGYGGKLFAESAPFNVDISFVLVDFFISFGMILLILFVVSFVFNYFYGQGAFCRILCPYGVLFTQLMNLNPLQKKITRVGECTGCRKCSNDCPQGIDVSREIHHFNGKVTNEECIKCYNCIDGCDQGVLIDSRKPAVAQHTIRKEYEREPWRNSQRSLQVTEPLSLIFDAASILVALAIGTIMSSFGGFWYYTGAIVSFVGFRKLVLLFSTEKAGKESPDHIKISRIVK